MLAPDVRTTLLSELAPPPGYTLGHLVATTFTLDLESALLPCLALAGSARAESADSVETIAAIRSTIDAIDIFHQNGQVVVPAHRSLPFALLERAIHGITPDRGLFHPKLWLADYVDDDGDRIVKLIVLTRNLTRDRSWDITLTLDGAIGTAPSARNKSLVALLRYLAAAPTTRMSANRSQRVLGLAERIRYAEWDKPSGVTDLDFHVFGVPGRPKPRPDFSGYRHLVISPFLNDDGIHRLGEFARETLTVVSRQEALDGLSAEMAGWIGDAYVLSPTAGIPTDDDETHSDAVLFNGLHAKLFATERAKRAHLFIGSTNATGAAFDLNVEILVELAGSTAVFGVERLLGSEGIGPLLEKTEIAPGTAPGGEEQHALDSYVRAVAAMPLTARLEMREDDQIDLHVTSTQAVPTADNAVTMSLSLLSDPSTSTTFEAGVELDIMYRGLALTDVTAFFAISVSDADERISRTVVKAELVNDIESRLDTIVTREISNPEAFRRFLALLLSFGELGESPDDESGAANSGNGQWNHLEQGLFEQLMRAAVAKPAVLDQLSGVVTAIIRNGDPHGVLPDGFRDLWSAIDMATAAERSTADV